MRLILLIALVGFTGCQSQNLTEPPPYIPFDPSEIPRPSISALRKWAKKVDRVVIHPGYRVAKKVTVEDRAAIAFLRELLCDSSVVASTTPPMLGSEPMMKAYRGETLLFLLRWQSRTKFQLVETRSEKISGSYEVPSTWYDRYMEFCTNVNLRGKAAPDL